LAGIYAAPVVMTAQSLLNLHNKAEKLNLTGMIDALNDFSSAAAKDNGKSIEKMLVGQMQLLHTIFTKAATHWSNAEYVPQYQAYGNIALKAQNLCRMTAETLVTMKNPPTIIKNTAYNQQVNVGTEKTEKTTNELLSDKSNAPKSPPQLEHQHHATMDTLGTPAASRTDKAMATMEKSGC